MVTGFIRFERYGDGFTEKLDQLRGPVDYSLSCTAVRSSLQTA